MFLLLVAAAFAEAGEPETFAHGYAQLGPSLGVHTAAGLPVGGTGSLGLRLGTPRLIVDGNVVCNLFFDGGWEELVSVHLGPQLHLLRRVGSAGYYGAGLGLGLVHQQLGLDAKGVIGVQADSPDAPMFLQLELAVPLHMDAYSGGYMIHSTVSVGFVPRWGA